MTPKHIAFIMDGNGRWAQQRAKPRNFGHRAGVATMERLVDAVFARGIPCMTVYAFSTENWSRPKDERDKLFGLIRRYLRQIDRLKSHDIRLKFLGDISAFDDKLRREILSASQATDSGTRGTLCIALNYGGRAEIVRAANQLASQQLPIDEASFAAQLYTAGLPDVDLIVRTGGQMRLSNFLLFQAAYAELFFSDTLWPDFAEPELDRILCDFAQRTRRYGGA